MVKFAHIHGLNCYLWFCISCSVVLAVFRVLNGFCGENVHGCTDCSAVSGSVLAVAEFGDVFWVF